MQNNLEHVAAMLKSHLADENASDTTATQAAMAYLALHLPLECIVGLMCHLNEGDMLDRPQPDWEALVPFQIIGEMSVRTRHELHNRGVSSLRDLIDLLVPERRKAYPRVPLDDPTAEKLIEALRGIGVVLPVSTA